MTAGVQIDLEEAETSTEEGSEFCVIFLSRDYLYFDFTLEKHFMFVFIYLSL